MMLLEIYNVLLFASLSFFCGNSTSNGNEYVDVIQQGHYACNSNKDWITYDEISISQAKIGCTVTELKQVIGTPDSISSYDNELSNQVHTLYYYGKSFYEFSQSRMVSFEISDNRLMLDTYGLKVGENIKTCSYLSRLFQEIEANGSETIELRIQVKDEDSAIIFTVDSTGLIKLVDLWVFW